MKRHKDDRYDLLFEGLDTFATVYLNGVELGSTDNMFISHTFEVTRELKKGKNVLGCKIRSDRCACEGEGSILLVRFQQGKDLDEEEPKPLGLGLGTASLWQRVSGRMSI